MTYRVLSCTSIGQGMVNGKFMHPLLDSRILGLFSIFTNEPEPKKGLSVSSDTFFPLPT